MYRARSQDVAQDMEQREQWSAQASADLCALYSISCAISCDRARYISGYDRYGLQTALEVKSDLGIELSDLDNLCSHVSLASKPLHELNETEEEDKWLPLTSVRGAQHAGKNTHCLSQREREGKKQRWSYLLRER